MKRLFLLIFPLFLCLAMCGCESMATIKLASFSNMTSAGSEDYTFKVNFENDKRYEEKYFDIQIMADQDDVEMTYHIEGENALKSTLTEKNVWNSLTSLKTDAVGLAGREEFDQLKEAVGQIYIFNVSKPCKLTFRVVVGQLAENVQNTGYVLLNTEPISDDFVLNCDLK